ncbi:hypothetical protein ACVX8N_004170 [Vibrio vulnificus]
MSTKTEIRVSVDNDFLNKLQSKLKLSKSTDVTRVALSLLDWASDEAKHNRMILSASKDGQDIHRLVMKELSNIEAEQKEEKKNGD